MAHYDLIDSGQLGADKFDSPVKQESDDLRSTMSTIRVANAISPGSGTLSPEHPTESKAKVHLQMEIERVGLREFLQQVLAQGEAWPYLDFAENDLGDEGARILCEVFGQSPYLRRLNLVRTAMTSDGLQEVGELMNACSRLEAVNLGGVSLAGQRLPDRLCIGVTASKSLRMLHLTHCRLTSVQARPLMDALVHCGSAQLERLNFSYNELDHDIVAELHHVLESCPKLQVICLSANKLGPKGGEMLASGVTKATRASLSQIIVDHNNLLQRGCCALVRAWKAVQHDRPLSVMDLRDNGLTEGQCQDLAQALGKPAFEPKLVFEGGARQVLLSWPKKGGSLRYNRHAAAHTQEGRSDFSSCDPTNVHWWPETRTRAEVQ